MRGHRRTTLLAFACAATVSAQTVTLFAGSPSGTAGLTDGVGASALLSSPLGAAVLPVAVGPIPPGSVVFSDQSSPGSVGVIRLSLPSGAISILAGNSSTPRASVDGTGSNAKFGVPAGIVWDSNTTSFVIADSFNDNIRSVTLSGVVTTLAGSGDPGFANGVGTNSRFDSPNGVTADGAGMVWVADTSNHLIRAVNSIGTTTTLAGGNGGTSFGFSNGVGTSARFKEPYDVAYDAKSGSLFVADSGNNLVRRIVIATAVVTTVAGGGSTPPRGFSDGQGVLATFSVPRGISVDAAGIAFVADTGNSAIRVVSPSSFVSTLAGYLNGTVGRANGVGTSASFSSPNAAAVDPSGIIYVADLGNNALRRIVLPPSASPTLSASPTATASPTVSATAAGASVSPTVSGSPTVSSTVSGSPTVSGSLTVSGSPGAPSQSPTVSASRAVASPSATPTSSVSPTVSPTRPLVPSSSSTISASPTVSASISLTPSVTPTSSITPSVTPTASVTPSNSPTASITASGTPTASITASNSPTASITPSGTPTASISASVTPTASITPSVSRTPSGTPSFTTTRSAPLSRLPNATATCTGSACGSVSSAGISAQTLIGVIVGVLVGVLVLAIALAVFCCGGVAVLCASAARKSPLSSSSATTSAQAQWSVTEHGAGGSMTVVSSPLAKAAVSAQQQQPVVLVQQQQQLVHDVKPVYAPAVSSVVIVGNVEVLPPGWQRHGPDAEGDIWYTDPNGDSHWTLPE